MLAIVLEKTHISIMQTLTLSEAQQHLTELLRDLAQEGELLIWLNLN